MRAFVIVIAVLGSVPLVHADEYTQAERDICNHHRLTNSIYAPKGTPTQAGYEPAFSAICKKMDLDQNAGAVADQAAKDQSDLTALKGAHPN